MPSTTAIAGSLSQIPSSSSIEGIKSHRNLTVHVLRHKGDTIYLEDVIGRGAFGVVYKAKVKSTQNIVALKQVLQDKRFKNRELEMLQLFQYRPHENIVTLLDSFYTENSSGLYLNLLLELMPDTLLSVLKTHSDSPMPIEDIKQYMRDLFKALAHLDLLNLCHRDIKPQNLLVDPESKTLKLADFGSAKVVQSDQPNISYICSRFYRAPELIFEATYYDTKIDVWGGACVFGELFLSLPLFPGKSAEDMLFQIMFILGIPTSQDIYSMNPNSRVMSLPGNIKPQPLDGLLSKRYKVTVELTQAIALLYKILVFNPIQRYSAKEVLKDIFFKE